MIIVLCTGWSHMYPMLSQLDIWFKNIGNRIWDCGWREIDNFLKNQHPKLRTHNIIYQNDHLNPGKFTNYQSQK